MNQAAIFNILLDKSRRNLLLVRKIAKKPVYILAVFRFLLEYLIQALYARTGQSDRYCECEALPIKEE